MSSALSRDSEYLLFRTEAFNSQFSKLLRRDGSKSLLFTIYNHRGGAELIAERLSIGQDPNILPPFKDRFIKEHSAHYDTKLNFSFILQVFTNFFKTHPTLSICYMDIRENYMAVIVSNRF